MDLERAIKRDLLIVGNTPDTKTVSRRRKQISMGSLCHSFHEGYEAWKDLIKQEERAMYNETAVGVCRKVFFQI